MNQRAIDDMHELLEEEKKNNAFRMIPVTTKNIGRRSPLSTMIKLVLLWPPKDIRLYESYAAEHGIVSYDDEIMIDIANGMQLELKSKNIRTRIAVFNVLVPANLDVFERYNLTVKHHNEKWIEMGAPKEVFDPKHGKVSPIKDTYVDPAIIESRHHKYPDSIKENKSYGDIAKARPNLKRSSILEISYQINPKEEGWEIGYVVKNIKGEILYFNHLYHEDIATIIRQSVQEIWGHPGIYGKTGRFLDGISMLFQGKKIPICEIENDAPPIMSTTAPKKRKGVELKTAEIEEKALMSGSLIFRYLAPITLTIALIIHIGRCLVASFNPNGEQYNRDMGAEFITGILILGAVAIFTQIMAKKMHRKSSQLNIKKRFI